MSTPERSLQTPGAAGASRDRGRPLIVELVGPAGAGKTSILQALLRRDPTIRPWRRFKRLQRLPVFLRHAIALVPTAWTLRRHPPATWRLLLRHLVRLRTLQWILARAPSFPQRTVIMDEGPAYSLCRLSQAQQQVFPTGGLPAGWEATVRQWPGPVDLVVWLDAPNQVLAGRIRRRSKGHEVKYAADGAVDEFLNRFRCSYRGILARWSAGGTVTVLEIDTAVESADGAAGRVLAAVSRLRRG